MDQTEKDKLNKEYNEITERMKGPFISPKDMRRREEITSLLMTDGQSTELRLIFGKPRKSQRVTSFTRDRR